MHEALELRFADIPLGHRASFKSVVTPEVVRTFAELSGDHSPLHVDESYASQTSFGHRIPHGMIAGMFFSRLIGMELPGRYALYLSQTLVFHQPLPWGGEVVVSGEVISRFESSKVLSLATAVHDHEGKLLVDGKALVKVLE